MRAQNLLAAGILTFFSLFVATYQTYTNGQRLWIEAYGTMKGFVVMKDRKYWEKGEKEKYIKEQNLFQKLG